MNTMEIKLLLRECKLIDLQFKSVKDKFAQVCSTLESSDYLNLGSPGYLESQWKTPRETSHQIC